MLKSIMLSLVLTAATAVSASAAGMHAAKDMPAASRIREGQPTMAPLAFLIFCNHYSSQCKVDGRVSQVTLNGETLAQMAEVNSRINRKIAPNRQKGGMDWSLETRYGNCNDYAIQKRDALHARGFPLSALSLTTAMLPDGQGHLILTVRTDRGDFVLDNLTGRIKPWSQVSYTLLKRQSATDPMQWVSINNTTEVADNSF